MITGIMADEQNIYISRDFLECPFLRREPYNNYMAFIDLGLRASENQNPKLERGEFLTTYEELAKYWLVSIARVMDYLDELQSAGLINYLVNDKHIRVKVTHFEERFFTNEQGYNRIEPPSNLYA